jgi:hypothetical protein
MRVEGWFEISQVKTCSMHAGDRFHTLSHTAGTTSAKEPWALGLLPRASLVKQLHATPHC